VSIHLWPQHTGVWHALQVYRLGRRYPGDRKPHRQGCMQTCCRPQLLCNHASLALYSKDSCELRPRLKANQYYESMKIVMLNAEHVVAARRCSCNHWSY
jgi:hypothetical protein